MANRILFALGLVLALSGCGADPAPAPVDSEAPGPDTAEQVDDGKADSVELRVRTGVTTLWVRKLATVDAGPAGPRVTIHARTSRNLASAFSWVPDDAFGTTNVVSARKLEVVLDEGHEINTLLSGMPILVNIDTTTGSPNHYTARFQLVPRLGSFHGSSALHPSTVVRPVYVRDEQNPLRYRGHVRGDDALSALSVSGAVSVNPVSTTEVDFDWTYESLMAAGFPAGNTITLAAEPLEKHAELELKVLSLSMTTLDPYSVWPDPECQAEVSQCIAATAGADLGDCGSYREVQVCGAQAAPSANVFAQDLSTHLVDWYAAHGADVAAMGGNSLAQAQAAVSASKVSELTDPEDDPYAHDFATTVVFSHPDVVFPGSDSVWFGAYDRQSGALLEVYDFN
ncbi:MAG: hypothetical protein KC776_02835 [Myxococcales bacterium]|nr:hypothetical protein [Myxococcales bacterium]MCB9577914.1 hypothetical protein [Polyangiaceae bacterium]